MVNFEFKHHVKREKIIFCILKSAYSVGFSKNYFELKCKLLKWALKCFQRKASAKF